MTVRWLLENGWVIISRLHSTFTYPADYMLAAAMNPYPKGSFHS